uniref:Uncharacterized protein n=1 Tax=Vespula pensylvanica TaxID=30213 RepID=A0A834JYM3_VESPE|nr:hypothetical protein H0235_016353 [Vespula pensylvanica]
MTDRPTYTEPSEQRSKEEGGVYLPLRKILDGTNVSLNEFTDPMATLASENCSIVGTKKDYPEEHASSESPGKEERTMNDDETGNDVKDGKGAIVSENGEEKTEKKNKTDTRRVKFSLGEETTIFPSPEEIEDTKNQQQQRQQEQEQQQQEDSNVQDEEIAMKEFLYYCSVHLVAYGICILIVVTTIVAGYCLTY